MGGAQARAARAGEHSRARIFQHPSGRAPAEVPAFELGGNEGELITLGWLKVYLRLASAFTVLLTTTFLFVDWWHGALGVTLLGLHLARIIPAILFFLMVPTRWFERHWRIATILASTPMLLASQGLEMAGGTAESFVYGAVIFLMVAAAVIPWSASWHTLLTVIAAAALLLDNRLRPGEQPLLSNWIELGGAAGLGYCINLVGARYRAELSQRLQTLRTIFATSPESIGLSDLRSGRFLEVGNSALLGYTREQTVGVTPHQLGLWANPAEGAEYVRRLYRDGVVHNMEAQVRRKNGSVMPVLISGAVMTLDGELRALSVTREITEIKQTQHELVEAREQLAGQVAALRESQGLLRAEILERETAQHLLEQSEAAIRRIFETSLEAITINRATDGAFIDVNDEFVRRFGFTRAEVIGRSTQALGMWPDRAKFALFIKTISERGYVQGAEVELRAKDGRLIPIRTSAATVEIHGEPCIVGFSHDISDQRRAQREILAAREAAIAASHAKSDFLSSMSHEIRTPMNAIIGMADLLAETALSEEQRRYVGAMQGNGAALLDLINDILDLAKVESGRLMLEHAEFDLHELVERTVETLAIRAYEKRLELIVRIDPAVPRIVVGDQLRVRQILINLLGNAIKFTHQGSVCLEVRGESSDRGGPSQVRFISTDSGIGIPPGKIRELFSPFMQADLSTARIYGGSGLGLAIVKRLIELMGGQISVTSEAGRGAVFSFVVPFGAAERGNAAVARVPRLLEGRRIYVADGHPLNRTILRELFERSGGQVSESTNGIETWRDLAAQMGAVAPPDLVLLDCRLEGIGGVEIASRLLAEHRRRERPAPAIILMISPDELGATLRMLREKKLNALRHYLVKPLRTSEITVALEHALGHPATLREVPTQSSGEPRSAAPPARGLNILVADDSPDNRMLIEAYLKKLPHRLTFVSDGQAAIDEIKSGSYDAVLMDIQMPVMDGYIATQRIREWEREQGIGRTAIVALTASAADEAVRRSLAAGCDEHVSKPVRKATLLRVLTELSVRNGRPPTVARDGGRPGDKFDMNKIVVLIDADLSDLVPGFLANKRDDAERILVKAEASDFEALRAMGHKLKGEGGSYGFDRISEIGAALEQAAADGDADQVRSCGVTLRDYLGAIEVEYGEPAA